MKKLLLLLLLFMPMFFFGQSSNFGEKTGCISGNCTNGYGTKIYTNGAKYKGDWKRGKRNGKGTYTSANGRRKTGKWKNNKLQEPKKPPVEKGCNRKSQIDIAN